MSLQSGLDNIGRGAAILSSTTSAISKGLFRTKMFFIVSISTFILGLGFGLTIGVYYGYRKWTNKVDKLLEQSMQYRSTIIDKVKDRINK